jgi:hypothetical protein
VHMTRHVTRSYVFLVSHNEEIMLAFFQDQFEGEGAFVHQSKHWAFSLEGQGWVKCVQLPC